MLYRTRNSIVCPVSQGWNRGEEIGLGLKVAGQLETFFAVFSNFGHQKGVAYVKKLESFFTFEIKHD